MSDVPTRRQELGSIRERERAFNDLCRKVAERAQQSFNTTGCAAHYLYFKPNGMALEMSQDAPPGFELGDPQAQRGALTVDQLTRWIWERARRLPLYPAEITT